MNKDSIAITSGGIDSITMLYEYQDKIELALSFDYGALINKNEIPFATYHCEKLNIKHQIIPLDFIRHYFHSGLLDNTVKSDSVPFRNGIMLSVACGFVENLNLQHVMIANNNCDFENFPDCRKDFIKFLSKGFQLGTFNKVEIIAPYTTMSKSDVIKRGIELGIDYSQTWSCYHGATKHCGKCNACLARKKAFYTLNISDPTNYEK